jgi:hypothetical protein
MYKSETYEIGGACSTHDRDTKYTVCEILVGISGGKTQLGKPRPRREDEDNIIMDLKVVGWVYILD